MTTYRNPVLGGDRPDPAVINVGDEYWMTYSSFESAPGLLLYRSLDLVTWEYVTAALAAPVGVTFAVDIAEVDGRFFIYIPFIPASWSSLSEPSIYVIHADAMEGPWSDPIDLGIRGAIDPGHVVGEDGTRYLFTNGVRRIALSDHGLSTVGELEHVYDGWRYPDDWVTEAYALEGPKLLRKDGWFYLISAVGGTAGPPTGHMVIAARSRIGARPLGEQPAQSRHPHDGCRPGLVVARPRDPRTRPRRDDWWMLSHGYENGYRTLGRQILLEPVTWTEDGWPVGSTDIGGDLQAPPGPLRRPSPPLGPRTSPFSPRPNGGPSTPRPRGGRAAPPRRRPRPRGEGRLAPDTSPLVTVAPDHSYEIEVDVELLGDDTEAGLLLYFNDRLYVGVGIDGARMRTYFGGHPHHRPEPAPAVRRLQLRIRNDRHIVEIHYREPGSAWTRHGLRFEVSGYHANTVGDLLSLRPALYATGHGSARFRSATYRPLS